MLLPTKIMCLSTFCVGLVVSVFSQNTKSTILITDYVHNRDTVSMNKKIDVILDHNTKNRVVIWDSLGHKFSLVIRLKENVNKKNGVKRKVKFRTETWVDGKWVKPKLDLWCDGFRCSFNRWNKYKTTSSKLISNTDSFHAPIEESKLINSTTSDIKIWSLIQLHH